jgi:hypothetical protein
MRDTRRSNTTQESGKQPFDVHFEIFLPLDSPEFSSAPMGLALCETTYYFFIPVRTELMKNERYS